MVKGAEILEGETDLAWLAGEGGDALRAIEEASGVHLSARGNKVHLEGAALAPYRVTYLQRWRLPESRVPSCNNPGAEPAAAAAPAATSPAVTSPAAPSKDAPSPNPAPKLVAPAAAPAEAPEKP